MGLRALPRDAVTVCGWAGEVPSLYVVVTHSGVTLSPPLGRLAAAEVPVDCDPTRIGQLVSNLIGNAITHGSREEPVRVHAGLSAGALELWVANGGRPIPSEDRERLFQPFFRGEVRASQQGLGLGLHIASEIARAHEGTLTVKSDENETRFTFRMPLADGSDGHETSDRALLNGARSFTDPAG